MSAGRAFARALGPWPRVDSSAHRDTMVFARWIGGRLGPSPRHRYRRPHALPASRPHARADRVGRLRRPRQPTGRNSATTGAHSPRTIPRTINPSVALTHLGPGEFLATPGTDDGFGRDMPREPAFDAAIRSAATFGRNIPVIASPAGGVRNPPNLDAGATAGAFLALSVRKVAGSADPARPVALLTPRTGL